ncbi:pilus assembly protein [Paenibacillus sp. LHD-117]|uniref:TadE/TadG family type IV pilus assembly protein n=1 Tax=Paenibacillus sp. LHD-117 TaxID=3071412 RepID=UPI0027DFFBBD|nr:pilus assembly protein [Paenibacillus sp. LHD-117]MDQ6420326.1 pilus assembly protein [Paenibacillus sp. LHD-117]
MRVIKWRRLWLKEDGTVTIFAVIVLSSLLLFFGTLIDYARIMSVQLMTEDAARSGVRSVLSAYDAWLYERYGLFGRGGTEGETIFKDVLEGNLGGKQAGSDDDYGLARTKVESGKLNTSDVLGEHRVFARQVLEEMKYKAPVDFTLEVVAKFVPLAQSLKQSSTAIDTLGELRRLYEKREALLEGSLLLQEQAAEAVSGGEALPLVPAGAASAGSNGESGTVQLLLGRFSEYAGYLLLDAERNEGKEPAYADQIQSYEDDVSATTQQLRSASAKLERRHAELLSTAKQKLAQAEAVNDEMRRVANRAQNPVPGGYDGVQGKKVPGSESYPASGTAAAEIEEIRKTGDRLVRESAWFTAYRNELNEQGTDGTGVTSEIDQMLSRLSQAMTDPQLTSAQAPLGLGVTEIQLAVNHYEAAYIGQASVLAKRRTELMNADLKGQLQAQEAKTASAWKEAGRLLNGLASLRELPEHRELFLQVKQRFEDNLLFNQKGNASAEPGGRFMQAQNADEAVELSSRQMEGLFSGMSEMLSKSRDVFYFGEYAAGKFSHFAPQQLLDLMQHGDVEGVAEAASFHNQEMEYVLYGFHDPMGNLIAAYGELFGARLAIRTMEGLIASRTLGHPLLILSAAVLYGIEKTTEDMLAFAQKGAAPLSKYVKTELSYLDYLRLFALLHGGKEEERLGRMIAVIEQNSDLVLAQVPTGVTGEATVSVKLWFLPSVTKMIGRLGVLKGRVKEGRYETTETVGWSY